MKSTLMRLILFALAVPGLPLLILFIPHFGYLWITVLLTVIGILCGKELRNMLAGSARILPAWSILFPGIAPVLGWTVSMEWLPPVSSSIALVLSLFWAFGDAVFAPESEYQTVIARMGTRMMMVLYPGFFLWWIQAIANLPMASFALVIFFFTVFLNDSAAWLFGMLLGKNRGVVAVSPNKSVEGFIAGIFASTGVMITASYLVPDLLPHPLWQLLLFGPAAGITTILGDLVESTIKRSAGVKDSGKNIMGRGGMLDSVDSLFFTAPLFVLFLGIGG